MLVAVQFIEKIRIFAVDPLKVYRSILAADECSLYEDAGSGGGKMGKIQELFGRQTDGTGYWDGRRGKIMDDARTRRLFTHTEDTTQLYVRRPET